ncbi:lmo0937 family membrane protein [Niastella vici]|uniref:lmo0937 family membrane protein n=1 Tax=Niastella vici TaxID=1703345 RepID=UPI00117EDCD1|nr:lmo0937 family membrane protein [Niastella vici]
MGNLLYIVALIFIVGWLVGFLGFHAGGAVHLLLAFALIALLVDTMQVSDKKIASPGTP